MKKVLELANRGKGYSSPNPMVGAVVVKNGEIIGSGYHKYYGGPHAEVYALDEAGELARGATLYVNLEPCSHYGKTPPCSIKIINSGIKRVVAAMEDPNPKVAGKGFEIMRDAGIEVEVGLLEKEAKKLNEIFIKYITTNFPFVILKSAQTIDGYLATSKGDAKWVTGKETRLFAHKLRHKVDAILIGINTVLNDNPSLTTRLEDREGKDSLRIILDSNLRTPKDAKIINQKSEANTLIVCGKNIDMEKEKYFNKKEGVELLSLSLNNENQIAIRKLLKILHDREISSILVEGGGQVNHTFLKEKLIDKYYAFIAPKLLGGSDGVSVFTGDGPKKMKKFISLKDIKYQKIADDFLIEAYLSKRGDC